MRVLLSFVQVSALGATLFVRAGEIGPNTDAFIKTGNAFPFIERNAEGSLVGITVWGGYANDEMFRELSSVQTLEKLRFSVNSRSNLLTSAGISTLSKAPKLTEVIFQCTPNAPDSIYRGLGQLRQIETLRFVATWPTNSTAARPLTNLVGLKRITISFVQRFSAEDVEILSQMPSLRDVKLWVDHVDEATLTPLIENKAITNLEIHVRNRLIHARGSASIPK